MSSTEVLENAGFTQLCLLNSVSFMFAKDVTTTKCYYSGRKEGFRVFIKTSTNEKELSNERNRLSTPFLKHPNIVELYDIHLDPKILIFPFHSGGNLEEMIDIRLFLPETEAFAILKEVKNGLQHLHENGFVHSDIKATNILFDENGNSKICDFEFCHKHDDVVPFLYGTLICASPEILCAKRDSATNGFHIGFEVDVWAFANLFCFATQGYYPFLPKGTSKHVLMSNVKERRYDISAHSLSDAAQNMLRLVFLSEPRISLREIEYFE